MSDNNCLTKNCNKSKLQGKDFCLRCIKINAEIQQIELFPKMLGALERIEIALANNNIVPTIEQTQVIEKRVIAETTPSPDFFIPNIDIPDAEIQGSKHTSTVITKNLKATADKLTN